MGGAPWLVAVGKKLSVLGNFSLGKPLSREIFQPLAVKDNLDFLGPPVGDVRLGEPVCGPAEAVVLEDGQ